MLTNLITTAPPARRRDWQANLDQCYAEVGAAHVLLCKAAEAPIKTHALSGRLYISSSGWLLLSVPNALGRGAFDALDEHGVELPPCPGAATYNAHISVMTASEVEQLGGPAKISERGHTYNYTLGPLKEVEPAGWKEMAKVWFIEVDSPDLRALRKSYGLTPLPNGDHQFHITVAVRKKKVLQDNDTKKAADHKVPTVAVDLDGTLAEYDGWKGEDHFGALRTGALKAMKEFQRKGYRIIIFTVRGNKDRIKQWLFDNDVPYDYINENPDQPPNSSGKVTADVYLDDRAIDASGRWSDIKDEAIRRLDAVLTKAGDLLPGGEGDDQPDSEFESSSLRKGQQHEREHTNRPAVAKEIAKDHLTEDKNYYRKLEAIEKTADAYRLRGDVQGVHLRKTLHQLLDELKLTGLAYNDARTGDVVAQLHGPAPAKQQTLSRLYDVLAQHRHHQFTFQREPTEAPLESVRLNDAALERMFQAQGLTQRAATPAERRQYVTERYRLTDRNGTLVGKVPQLAKQQLLGQEPIYHDQLLHPEWYGPTAFSPTTQAVTGEAGVRRPAGKRR